MVMHGDSNESLSIRMFGTFEVQIDCRIAPQFRSHSVYRQLLALLALHANHPGSSVTKEWTAFQLWGPSGSIDRLKQDIGALREALGSHGERLLSAEKNVLCL